MDCLISQSRLYQDVAGLLTGPDRKLGRLPAAALQFGQATVNLPVHELAVVYADKPAGFPVDEAQDATGPYSKPSVITVAELLL